MEGPEAKALAFLHEHFHERMTVEDLAGIAGVSAGFLGELFKSKTGESIHRYLMWLRIDRSRDDRLHHTLVHRQRAALRLRRQQLLCSVSVNSSVLEG